MAYDAPAMIKFDTKFPPLLTEVLALEYVFDDEDETGIDFEPYEKFRSPKETKAWILEWTGNKKLAGAEYRLFGLDGTGGQAAIWVARPGEDLLAQPIVFFGSEGELGVVANDFADYLWLLADGIGPKEAVGYGADGSEPNEQFAAFATKHALEAKKSGAAVLARVKEAFPTFEDDFVALCRH